MAVIRLSRIIDAHISDVFTALTDQDYLARWFAPNVITIPVTETYAAFAFEEDIHLKVLLKELEQNRKVVWEFAEGNLNWDDSVITFRLKEPEEGKTLLNFSHSGLKETAKLEKWKHSWSNFLDNLKIFTENNK